MVLMKDLLQKTPEAARVFSGGTHQSGDTLNVVLNWVTIYDLGAIS